MKTLEEQLTKKYGPPQERKVYRGVKFDMWFDSDNCQYCGI